MAGNAAILNAQLGPNSMSIMSSIGATLERRGKEIATASVT
jgi:hypothetical protein